jgi:hypothetical protein
MCPQPWSCGATEGLLPMPSPKRRRRGEKALLKSTIRKAKELIKS